MARFFSFQSTILTISFAICGFSVWTNYCAAISVSELKKFHCDDFCKIVTCESITDCSKGRIVRNASYCGCCAACIRFLELNEPCEEPVVGSLRDIKAPRCRNGLKCINGKCSQDADLTSKCLVLRKWMEEKRTEEDFVDDLWLPECDEDGSFKAKQVKKRKAICYSKQGTKLFGQEEPVFAQNMTCACSRHLDYLNHSMGISFNIYPKERCTRTGDFEQLQCIRDLCYCANPITGEVDSRVVKAAYISKLPCYDKKLHETGIQKECEKELQRISHLHFLFFQKGLKVMESKDSRPQCDFDGTFSSKQCDLEECRCTDETGVSIRSFYIGRKDHDILTKDRKMTCDCARDAVDPSRQYSLLQCESFGNYRQLQCFEGDKCFCVDEDGDIIYRMLNKTEDKQDEHCKGILEDLSNPS